MRNYSQNLWLNSILFTLALLYVIFILYLLQKYNLKRVIYYIILISITVFEFDVELGCNEVIVVFVF